MTIGIILWCGFNAAIESTNTPEFCISCHKMKDNVYREYLTTVHYKNRIGVRATCKTAMSPTMGA